MLRFPAISQLYKELSVLSSFEAWLTALSMKLAGEKKKVIKNLLRMLIKLIGIIHSREKTLGPRKRKNVKKGLGEHISKWGSC